MRYFYILVLLCALLTGPAAGYAQQMPKESFYRKSGWLDYSSNTLRRVAERGEQGAYDLYRNPNPAPRNAYQKANVHQANLNYLTEYKNSPLYRETARLLSVFTSPDKEPSSNETSSFTQEDVQTVRTALERLLLSFGKHGDKYPIITQAVLQISAALLPLDAQYHFFTTRQLLQIKTLQHRILRHPTHCRQGAGYRLFCEGRADALHGLAVLRKTDGDDRLMAQAAMQDLKEPISAWTLPVIFETLRDGNRADLLDEILARAVEKEGPTITQQTLDLLFISHWVDVIQNALGRYLGNVSSAGRLPAQEKGGAEKNVWEELAYLLADENRTTPEIRNVVEKYALGSCQITYDYRAARKDHTQLSCHTLYPFLVGALRAHVTGGAGAGLKHEAARRGLTPAAYVARAWFERVFGDLDAESEYRIDSLLHRVFAQETKHMEEVRQRAVQANQKIDEQIAPLRKQLLPYLTGEIPYFEMDGQYGTPASLRLNAQIAALEKQKTAMPATPDSALQMYTRSNGIYRRKELGQQVYAVARKAAFAADFVWGGYFSGAVIKGFICVRRGFAALKAGKVTADTRRLAHMAGELRQLEMQKLVHMQKTVRNSLGRSLAPGQSGTAARTAAAPKTPKEFVPKRTSSGRFPSGLDRDAELMRQWKQSYTGGHFTPRDQVEAVAGMKPALMNNILETIYYMDPEKASRVLMDPIFQKGRLPRFMYENRLIPSRRRLPAGYYKNRFNEKVERLTELASAQRSVFSNHAELDNILTSMKDYTFAQGFGFPNSPALTHGLHTNWKELTAEILTPGHSPDRLKMNRLWTKPVELEGGKSVSLQAFFSQKIKTVFFAEKAPDFFLNSPKWVELENVRRNLAAGDYMRSVGAAHIRPWWQRVHDWFVLGKNSKYLTLEDFGKIMADQYRRNPSVIQAISEAEQVPSSLTYRFNCFEGRACQAAITDGGAAYLPRAGYDGTREMFRFEARTQKNVKAVVFENPLDPKPRVVTLKSVSYVHDFRPTDTDLIRAGKMISDRLDETWDLLSVQRTAGMLPKIPNLKATIYPKTRLPGGVLPPDLTGGGANAYLALFTNYFYPVKTVHRLRWRGFKPVLEPQYYIRKEVPALAGSIHRERLTFLDQVTERILQP